MQPNVRLSNGQYKVDWTGIWTWDENGLHRKWMTQEREPVINVIRRSWRASKSETMAGRHIIRNSDIHTCLAPDLVCIKNGRLFMQIFWQCTGSCIKYTYAWSAFWQSVWIFSVKHFWWLVLIYSAGLGIKTSTSNLYTYYSFWFKKLCQST